MKPKSRRPRFGWLAAVVVVAAVAPARGVDVQAARQKADASYRTALRNLALSAKRQGLAAQVQQAQRWFIHRHPRLRYVFPLPAKAGALDPSASAGGAAAEWQRRFAQLRREQAKAYFQLAQQAAEEGEISLAVELANQAAREDPDHEGLRRLFGFQRYQDEWRTPYEISKLRAGHLWRDKYGWISKDRVERYERGQRYHLGRWITAAEDERRRRDIKQGWLVQTEHFSIRTNHSLEAGALLGARLERLYDVWRQVFAPYWLTRSQLIRALAGGSLPRGGKRYAVTYFRDRQDYQRALRKELPPDVTTTGYYMGSKKTAFFYHATGDNFATLYHEATHQLFTEAPKTVDDIGRRSDFWIVEGVACYMESLAEHEDYVTLGGVGYLRSQDARYYLFRGDFYEPIARFSRLGLAEFQRRGDIQRLYAQSAGLVDFLMHAEDGRYRDAVVQYAGRVHQGRSAALPVLAGVPSGELDKQYADFQRLEDADLAALPRPAAVTQLLLGGTKIGDAGLAGLPVLERLEWIDLNKTAVTNEGLVHLAKQPRLKRLDLSATKTSNAGLAHVGRLAHLENLVLGATYITDEGLAELRGLKKLTQLALWNTNIGDVGVAHLAGLATLAHLDLSGTDVTDKALESLSGLRRLESLDVSETRVTAEGVARLQRRLPKVKIKR